MPLVAAITGTDTVFHLATTTLADATAGGAWIVNPFITSVSSAGVVTGIHRGHGHVFGYQHVRLGYSADGYVCEHTTGITAYNTRYGVHGHYGNIC